MGAKTKSWSSPGLVGNPYLGTITQLVWWAAHWDFYHWRDSSNFYSKPGLSRGQEWYVTNPGPPYRTGWDFLKIDRDFSAVNDIVAQGEYKSRNDWYRYTGGFVPHWKVLPDAVVGWQDTTLASYQDYTGLESYANPHGPTGWNKFKPGKPTASFGQDLVEARDIPRMLKGTAKFFKDTWRAMGGHPTAFQPKSVADHYLNYEFGWLPFVSSIIDMYRTYHELDRLMNKLRQDNNKWVKVGGSISHDESTSSIAEDTQLSGHWPYLSSYFYPDGAPQGSGSWIATRSTFNRAWFSGRFKYWIDNTDSVLWTKKAQLAMFGLEAHPGVIYEVLPWSWLIDWFGNVGDNIANLQSTIYDGLVASQAFSMETTESKYSVTSVQNFHDGPLTNTWTFSNSRKSRTVASPFGFNLSLGDLTNRQIAILGALGLTML